MNHLRRRLPSPAGLAIGLLALVLAIGGTAYAVSKAPKNSVVSSSVKNSAIKTQDVKDDSLTGADIREDTLVLPKAATPPVTPAGPSGPATPTGPAGGDLAGAYPNPSIKPGAVGSAEIADGAIGAEHLAPGSINGASLEDGSIEGSAIKDGSLDTRKLDLDPGAEFKFSPSNSDDSKTVEVTCPAGGIAMNGGFTIEGPGADSVQIRSSIGLDDHSWQAVAAEVQATDEAWTLIVRAACL